MTLRNYLFTARFIQRILGSVFRSALLVDGIDTELNDPGQQNIDNRMDLLPSDQPVRSHPSAPTPFLHLLFFYT